MRPRLLILAIALVGGAASLFATPAPAALALPQTCGPYVDLTPGWGVPGDRVSVNVYNYPPNVDVNVIARVTGDPVVGTGKTDAQGHVNVIITIPQFTGDYLNIFVYAPPCNAAGAHFWYRVPTPTVPATPKTATPTVPTPPTPPTPPTVISTMTAPPTIPPPPPQPPISGSGSFLTGSAGFDLALVALALIVFSSGFTLWGSSRQKRVPVRIASSEQRSIDSDDYPDPPTPFN